MCSNLRSLSFSLSPLSCQNSDFGLLKQLQDSTKQMASTFVGTMLYPVSCPCCDSCVEIAVSLETGACYQSKTRRLRNH